MTHEQKLQAYRDGDYVFEARYLFGRTDQWTEEDWVRYIDRHGAWKR